MCHYKYSKYYNIFLLFLLLMDNKVTHNEHIWYNITIKSKMILHGHNKFMVT